MVPDGQYQVYRDAKVLNYKGVMTKSFTVERRVLIGSQNAVPEVHGLFTRHRLEWMGKCVGSYSEEIVQEFYTSYVVTLRYNFDRQAKPSKHDPLTQDLVRGF